MVKNFKDFIFGFFCIYVRLKFVGEINMLNERSVLLQNYSL